MSRARTGLTAALLAMGLGALPMTAATTPARAQDDDSGVPVGVPQNDQYADTDPSALTDFRSTLDPYGNWVDDPTYGTAWTPNPDQVGADFAPYDTGGQWDYVDGDYSWVSDYDWGWVCFHYGRWVYSNGTWLWIPGRDYAPAWVNWSISGSDPTYLGWAPTAPAFGWNGGVPVGLGFAAPEPWTFAAPSDVFGPGLSSRVVTGKPASALASSGRPYVPARPGVGAAVGRVVAQPVVTHGPPPSMLGIDVAHIPHAISRVNEVRARRFARPSTARPLGARPPAPHVLRYPTRRVMPRRGYGAAGRGGYRGHR